MERRHFLKITFGCAAGAVAFGAAAKAGPLALHMPPVNFSPEQTAQSALATQDDLDQATVEEVRWHGHRGHGGHGHWGHRRWGHRGWGWHHRRHLGWRRRHWHRRHYWGGYRRCWRDRWGYLRCRRRYYW
ncbi:MAG: twin-arginine translocation (Tat) [Xanthobacteraceae bacterium]|nr:twin-arginine translocation (Tat) [Xanthobacteraceae bacterium]